LPLVSVCVVGYYTARWLHSDSIYSESLRRKQPQTAPMDISALHVGDLMKPPPTTVMENASFEEITRYFTNTPYYHLPVVTLENRLRGAISRQDLDCALERNPSANWITAGALVQPDLPMVTPDMSLSGALEAFHHYRGERIPVVNNLDERVLVGSVSKTDVLLSLAHGIKGSAH
jgi:chloride channel protein, CIC family